MFKPNVLWRKARFNHGPVKQQAKSFTGQGFTRMDTDKTKASADYANLHKKYSFIGF